MPDLKMAMACESSVIMRRLNLKLSPSLEEDTAILSSASVASKRPLGVTNHPGFHGTFLVLVMNGLVFRENCKPMVTWKN